jgi:hypothetical protein
MRNKHGKLLTLVNVTSKVMLSGCSGMGKTAVLVHSIELLQNSMPQDDRLLVTKAVGNESHSLIPFTTIRPILLKLLSTIITNKNLHSSCSSDAAANRMAWNKSASCTSENTTQPDISAMADTFRIMAESSNVSADTIDQATRIVLNCDSAAIKSLSMGSRSAKVFVDAIVSLISRIVRACTVGYRLLIMAIDDIHHTDAASWLVVRDIFETSDNILIIGTNYATTDFTLHIDTEFAEALNGIYMNQGRYVSIPLGPLTREDLSQLAMKVLGLQREDLGEDILDELVMQSKGVAQFASKVLDDIKQRSSTVQVESTSNSDAMAAIILHRFDALDIGVRNTLNVGAVIGESFTLFEVMSVLKESCDTQEAELRRQSVESIKVATEEGILSMNTYEQKGSEGYELCWESDDTSYNFRSNIWRSILLGLMLDSRQQDVHRKIAQAMDKKMNEESVSLEFKTKLCRHWKSSGNTERATALALLTGKEMEKDAGNIYRGINLYEETLKMWGWGEQQDDAVGGISQNVLDYVGENDLNNILCLMVSSGRARSFDHSQKNSIDAFQDALKIAQVAKAAPQLKDRSVLFPAFTGLSNAIADGHIQQDAYCHYEQGLLQRFLEDTRLHGRLIHHIYALYLRMQLCSRQNDLEKAIAVQSLINQLYKPDRHSKGLRNVYGIDAGAMSFCLSSHYEMVLGHNRHALKSCRNIVRDLLPRIQTDFHQSFCMIYPLIFVLKECGYAAEGRGFFEKVVVNPFGEQSCTDNESFLLLSIYEPLTILLDLSKKDISEDTIHDATTWIFNESNGLVYESSINQKLGCLGRCADSIIAEICLLLAVHSKDGKQRTSVIKTGIKIAQAASIFNRKHHLTVAQKQVHAIFTKLKILMVPSSANRYLEV